MLTIVVVIAVIILFLLAIFSPGRADEVKQETTRKTIHLQRKSHAWWQPLTLFASSSLKLTRRLTRRAVKYGKNLRSKIDD